MIKSISTNTERIRELMKENNIKQTRLADEANFYQESLSRLFHGHTNNLELSVVLKIADYFKVPINDLLIIERF